MNNENDLKKYAGNVIRKLREHKNMTQDELAEDLKTTRQAISRYENGDRGVNQDLLFKLSIIFKVPIDEFFPPINPQYKKQQITKEDEIEIFKDILRKKGFINENENIDTDDINKLIEFAKINKNFILKNK